MAEIHSGHQGNGAEAPMPTFHDLQASAEGGMVRRAVTRYLVPKDVDRSIKWHERLGTPIVRKVVMGTVGRVISRPGGGGNYRLDGKRSKIEAANNFAFRGSVVNEVIHTYAATPATIDAVTDIAEGKYGSSLAINTGLAGFNLALVALQRYNRARMVKRVDEELQKGETFRPDYKSWTGIDARAVENFQAEHGVAEGHNPATEIPSFDSQPIIDRQTTLWERGQEA